MYQESTEYRLPDGGAGRVLFALCSARKNILC